jgi:probable rRNA maturation factor
MTSIQPNIINRQRKYAVSIPRLEKFSRKLCGLLKLSHCDFTLILSNDRSIRQLNRLFRHKDQPTDILSFPSSPTDCKDDPFENRSLGDMMVSVETAYRQAIRQRHSLEREIDILLIHGVLHLLGYDHERDQGQMHRKERRLQKQLLC